MKSGTKRRTDKVPRVCAIIVHELGVYISPISGFVVKKSIFSFPTREVMEGLDNSYIGAVVRPIGNFVGTVDAAIEVLGQVTCSIDFDPWKALLERSRDDLAACMHWSWILI